jgi:dihydrolipoamide dehydrogenase
MEIIVMPKLGFNMDEGVLTAWYKKENESVTKGEPLFAIETDKTSIDVEATLDGVVRKLLIEEGDLVPVTLPIAIIAGAEEDITAAEAEARALLGSIARAPAAAAETPAAAPAPAAKETYDFDVFIIGGGPGGYVAAIRARQLGLRTAIAEKDAFGGVCLNRGCIPTKTFLRSLDALNEAKEAAAFGVIGVDAKKAALDMKQVVARKNAVKDGLVKGVEGLLAKNKATVLRGTAKIVDKNHVTVKRKTYSTANLILATGSGIKDLPAGIVTKKNALTSDTILDLAKLPQEIVIIGGGVIGVEFAYFLNGAGVRVTIVEFLDRILPPLDAELAGLAHKDLEKAGITIHTSAKVTKVSDTAVEYEKDGKTEVLKTKNVLLAVGRAPAVPAEAEGLGVEIARGAIVTDENLETSVPGVYAIGDVNGKAMLAHTASAEGIVAAERIAGLNTTMDYAAIPSAIYTKPEMASCGLSEAEAQAKYGAGGIKVGKFPLMANGKSRVEGDERGLIKVITEAKYGEILGVHLYCLHATEMIAEAAVAIRAEATAEELAHTIHPHPTVSESVQEAFHAILGGAIHM